MPASWLMNDALVELEGHGEICGDSLPTGPGQFRRTFSHLIRSFSPILTGEAELRGWGLFGWTGEYSYMGWETVVDPDGKSDTNRLHLIRLFAVGHRRLDN